MEPDERNGTEEEEDEVDEDVKRAIREMVGEAVASFWPQAKKKYVTGQYVGPHKYIVKRFFRFIPLDFYNEMAFRARYGSGVSEVNNTAFDNLVDFLNDTIDLFFTNEGLFFRELMSNGTLQDYIVKVSTVTGMDMEIAFAEIPRIIDDEATRVSKTFRKFRGWENTEAFAESYISEAIPTDTRERREFLEQRMFQRERKERRRIMADYGGSQFENSMRDLEKKVIKKLKDHFVLEMENFKASILNEIAQEKAGFHTDHDIIGELYYADEIRKSALISAGRRNMEENLRIILKRRENQNELSEKASENEARFQLLLLYGLEQRGEREGEPLFSKLPEEILQNIVVLGESNESGYHLFILANAFLNFAKSMMMRTPKFYNFGILPEKNAEEIGQYLKEVEDVVKIITKTDPEERRLKYRGKTMYFGRQAEPGLNSTTRYAKKDITAFRNDIRNFHNLQDRESAVNVYDFVDYLQLNKLSIESVRGQRYINLSRTERVEMTKILNWFKTTENIGVWLTRMVTTNVMLANNALEEIKKQEETIQQIIESGKSQEELEIQRKEEESKKRGKEEGDEEEEEERRRKGKKRLRTSKTRLRYKFLQKLKKPEDPFVSPGKLLFDTLPRAKDLEHEEKRMSHEENKIESLFF